MPSNDTEPNASPPRLAPQCGVRIDAHGSKDRAKDASSEAARVLATECMPLWRMPTTFPSSATSGHPLSSARRRRGGITASCDGPIEVFVPTTPREERRLPEDRDAFHRHGRRRTRGGKDPSGLGAGLSLTPPTLCPRLGTVFSIGHCKLTVRSPACRDLETADTFFTRWVPCLVLTAQARHRARPTRPSARSDCLARTDASRSALTASTTRSSRPDVPRAS